MSTLAADLLEIECTGMLSPLHDQDPLYKKAIEMFPNSPVMQKRWVAAKKYVNGRKINVDISKCWMHDKRYFYFG